MPRISGRFVGAGTTVALVILPILATGTPAAAIRASHRHTAAMEMAGAVGAIVGSYSEIDGLDGRSVQAVRNGLKSISSSDDPFSVTVSGLKDTNHDGLDDDAKLSVRVFDNAATLTLRQNRSYSVADGGFIFRSHRSPLKESAESFDRVLRVASTLGFDTWNMTFIKELKAEVATGVRVVSDDDGNHDGYDDDGRLTFLANGKAATLTIGNTSREVGLVTYGPTWKTQAPTRVHHPAGRKSDR